MWSQVTGRGSWNPTFGRLINDWELNFVYDLLAKLHKVSIKVMEMDSVARKFTSVGIYPPNH